MAYAPQAWRDFAVTTGGLAGALTGLLFVAVSLHSGALNRSRSLASRAAQTLVLFMTPAIAAVLLTAPQPSGGPGRGTARAGGGGRRRRCSSSTAGPGTTAEARSSSATSSGPPRTW